MGLIRDFKEMPGGVKFAGIILGLISLACILMFLLPLIILVVAYPLVLVPIAGLAVMSLIGVISNKDPRQKHTIIDQNNDKCP